MSLVRLFREIFRGLLSDARLRTLEVFESGLDGSRCALRRADMQLLERPMFFARDHVEDDATSRVHVERGAGEAFESRQGVVVRIESDHGTALRLDLHLHALHGHIPGGVKARGWS